MKESIENAIEFKKEGARENNQYDREGKINIACIGDAGWSKRSNKCNYNAKSGAATLIGTISKKILYVGVKNKYCSGCSRARPFNAEMKHVCCENWNGSSSSMEQALTLG